MRPPRSPQPLGRRVTDLLPGWLRRHLAVVLGEQGAPLYLAGGVVRDLLRGVTPADIDLTVRDGARAWAARLAELCGGALVALGRDEEAARVVSGKINGFIFQTSNTTATADCTVGDAVICFFGVFLKCKSIKR